MLFLSVSLNKKRIRGKFSLKFSIVLSLNLYFGFNYIHKIVSLVLVFIILSSGIAVSAHTFILGILGLKGKIKEREDIENGD